MINDKAIEKVLQSLPDHLQQQVFDELEEKYERGDLSRPRNLQEAYQDLEPLLAQYRDMRNLPED